MLAALCGIAMPTCAEDAGRYWLRALDLAPSVAERIDLAVTEATRNLAETADACLSEVGSDWSQWSRLTFAGPDFLSVVHGVDFYCLGAAHPEQATFSMTFDLVTGERVEWSSLLQALPVTEDGSAVVGSADLQGAFLTALTDTPPECRMPLRDPALRFNLWLDGERRALAVSPNGLAHAEKACSDVAFLTVDQLWPLDPSPRLLSALAKAAQP